MKKKKPIIVHVVVPDPLAPKNEIDLDIGSDWIQKYREKKCKNPGEERYEYYHSAGPPRRRMCQYDYRARNGRLFSCDKPTLESCRAARDAWLKNNGLEG